MKIIKIVFEKASDCLESSDYELKVDGEA